MWLRIIDNYAPTGLEMKDNRTVGARLISAPPRKPLAKAAGDLLGKPKEQGPGACALLRSSGSSTRDLLLGWIEPDEAAQDISKQGH